VTAPEVLAHPDHGVVIRNCRQHHCFPAPVTVDRYAVEDSITDKIISAADANRNFAKLLRAVRKGQSYVVTSRGKPVATIVPADSPAGLERRSRTALLTRLRSEPVVNIGRWSRDELNEDAP